ncbi:MAG: alpha/beta hydrolase [Crocinitomicaceae bacterium]
MELNWIEIGNLTSDETIIFLHEGLGCIELWKGYPEKVCETLNVKGIVYDRSGYGKSPGNLTQRKADYLHLAADELFDFINYLKLKSVHLYGHSDGGSIALIFASKYTNRVKSIVTEAAHVFNEPETIKGVQEARPLLKEGRMEGLRKYHGDRYQEVFYAWNDIWLDDSFEDWNIEKEIKSINCPALIIQGLEDQYGTLKQVEAISNAIKDNVKTFTPNHCGHAPFKEQTALVLNEITQFYNEFI